MYWSGGTPLHPRVSSTVCPRRVLDEDPEAEALVRWWLNSTAWDAWIAGPVGPPEWPYPGGLLRQPAALVDAVMVLRAEWPHLPKPQEKDDSKRGRERKR